MRVRLNKTQAQMLVDGKALRFNRRTFGISEKESDMRTLLKAYAGSQEVRDEYDYFLNLDTQTLEIERRKS